MNVSQVLIVIEFGIEKAQIGFEIHFVAHLLVFYAALAHVT